MGFIWSIVSEGRSFGGPQHGSPSPGSTWIFVVEKLLDVAQLGTQRPTRAVGELQIRLLIRDAASRHATVQHGLYIVARLKEKFLHCWSEGPVFSVVFNLDPSALAC